MSKPNEAKERTSDLKCRTLEITQSKQQKERTKKKKK